MGIYDIRQIYAKYEGGLKMDMKKKLAEEISKKLNDEQKKEMMFAFYEKHKNDAVLDELLEQMKMMLDYNGEMPNGR